MNRGVFQSGELSLQVGYEVMDVLFFPQVWHTSKSLRRPWTDCCFDSSQPRAEETQFQRCQQRSVALNYTKLIFWACLGHGNESKTVVHPKLVPICTTTSKWTIDGELPKTWWDCLIRPAQLGKGVGRTGTPYTCKCLVKVWIAFHSLPGNQWRHWRPGRSG